jgi:hypothetical protein
MCRAAVLVIIFLLGVGGTAQAKPGLLVGVTEDGLKFEPDAVLDDARDLGVGAIRITLRWHPGLSGPTAAQKAELSRATKGTSRITIVLSVFGERAVHAPTTETLRDEYCGFLEEVVRRYDRIRYVTIWNEPNKTFFWSPQFNSDGSSAAPAAYQALLARCWDVLHEAQSDVKVIAPSTAPRGNDNPQAVSNISHSPTLFVRELGRAYRESGRDAPIFDVVGHHVHGIHSAERPWRAHRGSGVAQGDLQKLEEAFSEAFADTAQPFPGRCVADRCVPVWWLEVGFQTKPDRSKASLYQGFEISPRALPDSVGDVALDPLPDSTSLAPDQATQIVSALRLAYCQPHVEAFFNFLLWDEQRLEGWQSAPFWPDRTPKGSYAAFRAAIRDVTDGEVECTEFRRSIAAERARTERPDAVSPSPASPTAPGSPAAPSSPAPGPTQTTESDGLPSWLVGAAVAAGILLVGGGLIFLLHRRRPRYSGRPR